FHLAQAGGRLQLPRRPPLLGYIGGIKAGEVLAYDLRGQISVDSFRASVPADHTSFGIEHKDGVLLHAIDEETEALLAALKRLLRFLALGHVARDLQECP